MEIDAVGDWFLNYTFAEAAMNVLAYEGDEGSPGLIVTGEDEDMVYALAGIALATADATAIGTVDSLVRVAEHFDWIKAIVEADDLELSGEQTTTVTQTYVGAESACPAAGLRLSAGAAIAAGLALLMQMA